MIIPVTVRIVSNERLTGSSLDPIFAFLIRFFYK